MTHASDMELDALRLGAGSDGVRAHVASCPACSDRQALLAAQAEAFLERHNVAALAADLDRRRPRWRLRFAWPAAAAAAAVGVALFILPDDSTLRTKGGGPVLEIFQDGRSVRGPIARASPVRVRIDPAAPSFVHVLHASTSTSIEALYPGGDAPWRVFGSEWVDREIVLDSTSSGERLIAVLCEEPFDRGEAIHLARGEVRLGCTVHVVEIAVR